MQLCRLAIALTLVLVAPAGAEQPAFVETRSAAPQGQDSAGPAWPIVARLSGATDRYDHDVLGGIPPWSVLEVQALSCGACRSGVTGARAELPADLVFEDVAPRLWNVTGDGRPEIVVVESHIQRGARLAVWALSDRGDGLTRLAATDFIGARHRWLAPAGVGDFDGDGRIEIAYVDRPHLAREPMFVRIDGAQLTEVARAPGYSAHRIGDTVITAAVRRCGGDQVLVPDARWQRLLAVSLQGGQVVQRDMGAMTRTAMARALRC